MGFNAVLRKTFGEP